MGTQGVVSLTLNGKTVVKAVCGCDGMHAVKLACRIRRERLVSVQDIYKAAQLAGFGCRDCLVVMGTDSLMYRGEKSLEMEVADRCAMTFFDPKFNPRQKNGGADYVELVKQEEFCPWLCGTEEVEVLETFPGVITGEVGDTLYPVRVGGEKGKGVEGHVGQEDLRAFPYPISVGAKFVWVRYRRREGKRTSHIMSDAWPAKEHWNTELRRVWDAKACSY